MLDLAYFYQIELNECLKSILKDKDLYFYFMFPFKFFSFHLENSDSNTIQFISKDNKGNIIGYLAAYISRINNSIENIDLINFTGRTNIIFSRDAKLFFDEIFINRHIRKITFHTIAQNPSISMYRKFVKKFNGREVGILQKNKILTDGNYYDEIIFEIFREGYLNGNKIKL